MTTTPERAEPERDWLRAWDVADMARRSGVASPATGDDAYLTGIAAMAAAQRAGLRSPVRPVEPRSDPQAPDLPDGLSAGDLTGIDLAADDAVYVAERRRAAKDERNRRDRVNRLRRWNERRQRGHRPRGFPPRGA
jgi:hypothetical protein